jgi:hypothetical protein
VNAALVISLFAILIAVTLLVFLVLAARANGSLGKRKRRREEIATAGLRDLITRRQFDDAIVTYQKFTGSDIFTAESAIRALAEDMGVPWHPEPDHALLTSGDAHREQEPSLMDLLDEPGQEAEDAARRGSRR